MANAQKRPGVNNEFYNELGKDWIIASDHPVALLRAEAPTKLKFVLEEIHARFGPENVEILDLGCGAGFLANSLSEHGYNVTGVDRSPGSLEVARQQDLTRRVRYQVGDAYDLGFHSRSFDVVCAMDLLEHVEDPAHVVRECARVLSPGGVLIFHTFNRTVLSWLLAVKGLEWFVANSPPRVHLLRLFIRPSELDQMCRAAGLHIERLTGIRPALSIGLLRLIATRRVPEDVRFRTTRGTSLGYMGSAVRFPHPA
ncbi:MAG: 3-demethylubiquinone-9 3-O-methyltransferase [Bdellovibrionales bacterium GWB1_55_8]|nr:MAG: 3-demethylubiquinone-9 3-O-methyltransferase [Bdellovibrionales bacterium GWB1_55_8]